MARTALTPITTTRRPYVSKSKFLQGRQCDKLLWSAYHAKHLFPAVDAAQQAVFDQGHEVGALAQKMYPDGILINVDPGDFAGAIRLTKENLRARRPLFEAALTADGGYARADILNPAGVDAWDLIEVKSTTSLKADVHLPDLAFQAHVLAEAGVKLRKCFLAHINNQFVRHGPIDPQQFFTLADVTKPVAVLRRDVAGQLAAMQLVIAAKEQPEIPIGIHCDNPYMCPLHDQCWAFLPDASVFTLYRGGSKAFTLLQQGIQQLGKIPDDFALTDNQAIQRRAVITGEPHVDRPALAAFLGQLEYPISYLDFETFSTAIPLHDGVRPYQQIPFQYSLHVVRSAGAKPEHYEFLAAGSDDPRPEFMRRLRADLPKVGSVVVYNASFEKARLAEGCELLPKYGAWYRKVEGRMVDLLLPFRGFRYYHGDQQGSASMKAVLPVLTGRSYDKLEIQEGGTASMEFLRVTFGDVPEAERQRVRRQLEAYCGQDTEGMLWIVEALEQLSRG